MFMAGDPNPPGNGEVSFPCRRPPTCNRGGHPPPPGWKTQPWQQEPRFAASASASILGYLLVVFAFAARSITGVLCRDLSRELYVVPTATVFWVGTTLGRVVIPDFGVDLRWRWDGAASEVLFAGIPIAPAWFGLGPDCLFWMHHRLGRCFFDLCGWLFAMRQPVRIRGRLSAGPRYPTTTGVSFRPEAGCTCGGDFRNFPHAGGGDGTPLPPRGLAGVAGAPGAARNLQITRGRNIFSRWALFTMELSLVQHHMWWLGRAVAPTSR